MFRDITELLFHPDAFFGRKNHEKQHLVIPAAIVGIGCILGLITPVISSAFHVGSNPAQAILTPFEISSNFFSPIIAWILITVFLYSLCRLLNGTGSFILTFQNAGYGCLPLTFFSFYILLDGILWGDYFSIPLRVMIVTRVIWGLIATLCIVWSGWLWTVAMERTHTLSRNKAATAAAITAFLYMCPMILRFVVLLYVTDFFLW